MFTQCWCLYKLYNKLVCVTKHCWMYWIKYLQHKNIVSYTSISKICLIQNLCTFHVIILPIYQAPVNCHIMEYTCTYISVHGKTQLCYLLKTCIGKHIEMWWHVGCSNLQIQNIVHHRSNHYTFLYKSCNIMYNIIYF